MRGLLRVFGALLCMAVGASPAAFAQDYNPNSGASTAPADGTLTTPASPNGVDWLNSMLGLSPSFRTSTGQVNGAHVNVDLSAYVTQTTLDSTLASYLSITAANNTFLPLTGGTLSGGLTLKAQSTVQAGLVFWSRTYAALPANPPTNVLWKCDDCTIGSGSAGVFVYYNGSEWVGMSGEAVTHP